MFIELLTDEDKQLIDYMRKFGAEKESYFPENFVDCDYFLRFWEKSKTFFKDIFKNKLIIKKRINLSLEEETLQENITLLRASDSFKYFKWSIIEMLHKYNEDKDCLFATIKYYLFNSQALIYNRYEGSPIELTLSNSKKYKLVRGCKIMKILRRLAKEANVEKEFEEIRLEQSQILNEAHISATLCLSIHPLDYITASYNYCDWESCMNWEQGDYRRGVIEMMNSKYVIVAYLESDSTKLEFNIQGKTIPWNSKKWREFFIVSEDGIFGIKGYPYWNRKLESLVLKTIKDLLVKTGKTQYSDSIIHWDYSDSNRLISPHFHCGPAMYNDFYEGNYYQAIIARGFRGHFKINYSGASECVICGHEHTFPEDSSSSLVCEDCYEHHYCTNCEEEIEFLDDICFVNGEEYCSYCYNNYFIKCNCCNEITPIDKPYYRFIIGKIENNKIDSLNSKDIILYNVCHYFPNMQLSPDEINICDNCVDQIFVKGKEEVSKTHLEYFDPNKDCCYNVIDYRDIKDLNKLNIFPRNLNSFMRLLCGMSS